MNNFKEKPSRPKNTYQYIQFILFESFRATGLSLLTMNIFPLLDIPRCIMLTCTLHSISYIQNALHNFQLSYDLNRSIKWRFNRIFASLPSALLFIILFSGAYLWCLLEGYPGFHFGILLPISFFLSSLGYWESWIDARHTTGFFQELYQVSFYTYTWLIQRNFPVVEVCNEKTESWNKNMCIVNPICLHFRGPIFLFTPSQYSLWNIDCPALQTKGRDIRESSVGPL